MISLSQSAARSEQDSGRDYTSLAARASGIAEQAEGRLADAAEIVKTVVNNRPVLALGAALAAGVFVGWLIKRR